MKAVTELRFNPDILYPGVTTGNNNNNGYKSLMPQLTNEVLASIVNRRLSPQKPAAEEQASPPQNIDELMLLAREMLMQEQLEVSKVKPLFWSMIETYVDRFQDFPFDVSKALQSYLEVNKYPSDMMRGMVLDLEKMYARKHGKPMKQSTQLIDTQDSLDDEVKALRESLKYAAVVGGIE